MSNAKDNKVTLETTIKRGDKELTEIEVLKPNSGALRGASLRGLLDFQADDIITVVPRVTVPALTPQEAQMLDPVDLVQFGGKIAGFLLPKRIREEAEAEANALNSPTA